MFINYEHFIFLIHADYPNLMDAHYRQNLRLPQRGSFTFS